MTFNPEEKIPLWSSKFEAYIHCSWSLINLLIGSEQDTTLFSEKCKFYIKPMDEKKVYYGSDFSELAERKDVEEKYMSGIQKGHAISAWNMSRMHENGISGEINIIQACVKMLTARKLFTGEEDKKACQEEIIRMVKKYNHTKSAISEVLKESCKEIYDQVQRECIVKDNFDVSNDEEMFSEVIMIMESIVNETKDPISVMMRLGDIYASEENKFHEYNAIYWYKKAIGLGCDESIKKLAEFYEIVSANNNDYLKQAYYYYQLCWNSCDNEEEKNNIKDAINRIIAMSLNNDELDPSLLPTQSIEPGLVIVDNFF